MFEHELEESKTGRVPIQDIDPDVFHQLLHYIYSGRTKTQLTEEIAQPLYVAADKYDIKVLRNEITFYLRSCIRVDNVIFLMIFAHLHSIENLKKSTIDFVKANAPQIVQQEDWANLIKNYPDLSVEVTRSLLGWCTVSRITFLALVCLHKFYSLLSFHFIPFITDNYIGMGSAIICLVYRETKLI